MTNTDPPSKQKIPRSTPEQRYAAALAQAARAKDEMRRRDTREKVIIGALTLRRALRSPASASALIMLIEEELISDTDLLAVRNLLGRLHLAAHPIDRSSAESGISVDSARGEA